MSAAQASVVIPNLDSGPVLDRCLDALEVAEGVGEILVLDAGSSDGSDERARRRTGVTVLDRPGTTIMERLNLGMREAKSDLCLLLNSDAFVDPQTPRLLAERLLADPGLGAVGASLRYEDGSPQKSGDACKTLGRLTLKAARVPIRDRSVPRGQPPREGLTEVGWLAYSCGILRRQAWEQAGGFVDDYDFYFEDVDFARAIDRAGWKQAVDWEATAIHVGGGTTRANDPSGWYVTYHRNALIYLRRWYPRGWRLFAAVWMVRAALNSALWRARAVVRGLRNDEQGAALARNWADAFRLTLRP